MEMAKADGLLIAIKEITSIDGVAGVTNIILPKNYFIKTLYY
jgi:hypothetical protein